AGDAHQLALAVAQLGWAPPCEVGDADRVERGVHLVSVPCTVRAEQVGEHAAHRGSLGGDLEVLADGEVVEELDRLPGAPEPEACAVLGSERGDLATPEGDPTTGRREAA